MAQSLALSGTSAQIIFLPTAASQPVIQKNGPGRRPLNSNIINLHRWKFGRVIVAKVQGDTIQSSLEQSLAYLQTCEFLFKDARGQYLAAQQRAASVSISPVSIFN